MLPYFDFRYSMLSLPDNFLACYFVCLLSSPTRKRDLYLVYHCVPITWHIDGAQYIFLNEEMLTTYSIFLVFPIVRA